MADRAVIWLRPDPEDPQLIGHSIRESEVRMRIQFQFLIHNLLKA